MVEELQAQERYVDIKDILMRNVEVQALVKPELLGKLEEVEPSENFAVKPLDYF